ncbi:MAG: hypothetical protein HY903_10820 [Deltaproteobacteria bacterium]|nr:hypothetical protein [Deltaproteobacteria bacterium]
MRAVVARFVLPAVVVALSACAHPQKPAPFANSSAFHAVSGSTYGILERDLDGDQLPDAVVAKKTSHGFAPVFYRQQAREGAAAWARGCEGEVAVGVELDTLTFVDVQDGSLAMLAAAEDNPDEVILSLVVVDLTDDCRTRYKEQLRLPRPAPSVLSPGSVMAGVFVKDGAPGFQLIDRPRVLHLQNADGPVDLLTGVRVRVVAGTRAALVVRPTDASFLAPLVLAASWVPETGEPVALPELVDGDDATAFGLRPGETGVLAVTAPDPLSAIEVVYGCTGEDGPPLELALLPAAPLTLGSSPAVTSFVAASGRTVIDSNGARHELLALRQATVRLELALGPAAARRCLRGLEGYALTVE